MLKARLIRYLFGLHRWMGVGLGLLMLMWCLSGFVMIFVPYPATSGNGHDLRRDGLAAIALPGTVNLPPVAAVPEDAKVVSAGIEMLAADPVLRLRWRAREGGGGGTFDLVSGQKIATVDPARAIAVATTYAERHGIEAAPSIKRSSVRDEFTVSGGLNPDRPLWQARLNDAAKTMLYVSSTSGEIKQITTASQRFWSWLGAIPHWLYFTELRKDAKLWTGVVVWASLAGCFLTVLGLFVGIRQLRRRHSTGHLASPYRGVKSWHHMLGLVFGVLVLTWTFSGFTSMQPWGWLGTGEEAGKAASAYSEGDKSWLETRNALAAQIAALRADPSRDVVELNSSASGGSLYFIRIAADGSRQRLASDGRLAPFDAAGWQRAGAMLASGKGPANVELMTKEDAYFYKGAASSRLPVVRVTVPAMRRTRFYLDAVSGQVVATADPGDRGFRWWHLALHRLDFAWLRVGWLRQTLEILLLAGVSAVCGIGAWMGVRKLMRGGKLDGLPKSET
jgi:uncharacterized iron-regulated membrane protein